MSRISFHNNDDEPIECASPPCFMHEIDAGYYDIVPISDAERRSAIMAWRKSERTRLIAERLAMSTDARAEKSHRIASHLNELAGDVQGRVLSLYWPLRGEPDLRSWADALTERGAIVALPVVIEKNAPMIFRTWKPGEPLVKGFWNIPVPEYGAQVAPDICLAPFVGHDAQGFRLGYGGGYFDRTLAALPIKPFVAGVGYAQAAIRTIYPLSHDIPLNAIVTERGVNRIVHP